MQLRFGITHKLTLVFVLFAAILLGSTEWLAYDRGKAALEGSVIAELETNALEKQAALEDWLGDRARNLIDLSDLTQDLAQIGRLDPRAVVPDSGQTLHDEVAAELRAGLRANQDYDTVFILDPADGNVLISTDSADEGRSQGDTAYFRRGRIGPYVGSAGNPDEKSPALFAAVPLRVAGGRLAGVLAGRLKTDELNEMVRRRAGLHATDDAFLADAAGLFVSPPRLLADPSAVGAGSRSSEAVRRCLTHGNGVLLANDYRDVPAITVYRWLAPYGLCLVVKLDHAEALAPAHQLGRHLLGAGLLLLLLAAALAALLARTVTRRVRVLEAGASKIERGDRSVCLPETSGDELGMLARTFNRMTAALADRETQLRAHASNLEQRVAEKTRQLAERADELARSNIELERFAYVASHDLQEPLRMVASYTQLLGRRYKGKLDADADEFIAFAVDGASRMQALINDLLAYSRVSTKGQTFQAIDIGGIVDRALANLQAVRAEGGVIISRDALPTIDGDASQLMQLFQNLIGNAIKFRGDRRPEVHIGAARDDTEWVFSVSDNGIGIDPKYVDQLFVIFKRLHTRAEYPGTGIGLAICKKIVERHGGDIWIESVPQQGTTFYFTIPDRAAAGTAAPAADGIAAAA